MSLRIWTGSSTSTLENVVSRHPSPQYSTDIQQIPGCLFQFTATIKYNFKPYNQHVAKSRLTHDKLVNMDFSLVKMVLVSALWGSTNPLIKRYSAGVESCTCLSGKLIFLLRRPSYLLSLVSVRIFLSSFSTWLHLALFFNSQGSVQTVNFWIFFVILIFNSCRYTIFTSSSFKIHLEPQYPPSGR